MGIFMAEKKSSGVARTAFMLSVLGLGFVGLNFYGDLHQHEELGAVREIVDSSIVAPEVVQRVAASTYKVVTKSDVSDAGYATAFVVDHERGLLATNIHVARDFNNKKSLEVHGIDGSVLHVEAVMLHKGFDAFSDHVWAYQPVVTYKLKDPQGKVFDLPMPMGTRMAYDVALMKVREEDIPLLAPALPVASEETLYDMKEGDPIALVGYPGVLSLTTVTDRVSVTPKTSVGRVSSMVSFVGSRVNEEVDREGRQLMIHHLLSGPGASGSPIVNAAGEVVAVNQGGLNLQDVVIDPNDVEQVSLGNRQVNLPTLPNKQPQIVEYGDNIAHRADILADLLRGDDETRLESVYRKDWDLQLQRFGRMPYVLVSYFAERLAKPRDVANAVETTIVVPFKLGQPNVTLRRNETYMLADTTIELDPSKFHVVLATDYRGQYGFCNPLLAYSINGQPLKVAGDLRFGDNWQLFLAPIEPHSGSSTVAITLGERHQCGPVGRDVQINVFSWEPEDLVIADAKGPFASALMASRERLANSIEALRRYFN